MEKLNGRKTEYRYDNFGNRTHEIITNINDPQATGGIPKEYGAYTYEYAPNSNRLDRTLKDNIELEGFIGHRSLVETMHFSARL